MSHPYFALIDTFADLRFSGNPAGVCILAESIPDSLMQQFAMEVNQAETAFLIPGDEAWRLRWFTPACEVDLCGHATMAAAVALWRQCPAIVSDVLRFNTRSGLLLARKIDNPLRPGVIFTELDFPQEEVRSAIEPAGLCSALGLANPPRGIYRNRMDYLVEIDSFDELTSLQPDMRGLASIETRGVIVTTAAEVSSPSGELKSDFVSRFFAPRFGVDEDPATGSAHCALLPFWEERLQRPKLVGYQASRRGGWLECERAAERVLLRGWSYCSVEGKSLVVTSGVIV